MPCLVSGGGFLYLTDSHLHSVPQVFISYKAPTGDIVNCEHDAIGNMAVAFVGTSGVQMGWLASQADMLADDWVFAE